MQAFNHQRCPRASRPWTLQPEHRSDHAVELSRLNGLGTLRTIDRTTSPAFKAGRGRLSRRDRSRAVSTDVRVATTAVSNAFGLTLNRRPARRLIAAGAGRQLAKRLARPLQHT